MKKLILIAVGLASLPALAGPSFDCANASTSIEKTICSDEYIGNLDGLLSANYKALFGSAYGFDDSGKAATKEDQKAWVAKRNQCSSKECITDAYKQRIDEICQIPVVSGVNNCQLSSSLAMGVKQTVAVDAAAVVVSPSIPPISNAAEENIPVSVTIETDAGNSSADTQQVVITGNEPVSKQDVNQLDDSGCQWPEELTRVGIDRNTEPSKFQEATGSGLLKVKNQIMLPNSMKTKEEILAAQEYLDKIEPEIRNRTNGINRECLDLIHDTEYKLGHLSVDNNVNYRNEMDALLTKKEIYENDLRDISKALDIYREMYKVEDARDRILFASNDKVRAEKKAAQDKRAAELREKAYLTEEEYLVPLFECSVQGSYWCFSSNHKVYAVTDKVTISDGSDQYAAVYQEVGQGEVNDYYKDKSSIAAEIFMGRDNAYSNAATQNYVSQIKMWVAGTGRMPHVFMDKKRR